MSTLMNLKCTLSYRGSLKANGDAKHKQQIRRMFHDQLSALVDIPELEGFKNALAGEDGYAMPDVVNYRGFRFVPLLKVPVALDVTFLLAGEPNKWADIDNLQKTLFDALRVPGENEIPAEDSPSSLETPSFFCLLINDNLIRSPRLRQDRLLGRTTCQSEALVVIRIESEPFTLPLRILTV